VVRPTLPAPQVYGYRNKMEFTFSDQRWIPENDAPDKRADFALGLHVPGRFDKVLDIDRCPLQSDLANGILHTVQELVRGTGLPPYGARSHRGVWRFLVLREGKNTGDLMVHFITSGQEGERTREAVDGMVETLAARHPAITTVTHATTYRLSQVAYGEKERTLRGAGKIREVLLGRTFEISSGSFFQTNTRQAEKLFDCIADLAELSGTESVYDLYCGAGAIGLSIAHRVKSVVGVESVEPAVRDALRNAGINGITNVVFAAGDMKHALRDETFRREFGPPDVVILDPPRGGTHPDTISDLLALDAPKIIYVSCNPPVFARDAKILCGDAYELGTVQPVDMFPHTGHVEIVAVLRRKIG
jgi:23S rRNA (uracil1939-C5)-methyltransferase